MDNNEEKTPYRIKEVTIKELMEWQLACQRNYRKQGIISTDGLILPIPQDNHEEYEWDDYGPINKHHR